MKSMRCLLLTVTMLLVWVRPLAAENLQSVEVIIAGSISDASALESSFREPLAKLGVIQHAVRVDRIELTEIVAPKAPFATRAIMHLWVDILTPGMATLYMADADWERVLVRRVALPNGLDEVGREALAYIVKNAVGAMLGGAKIGVSRDEAKATLTPDDGTPDHEAAADERDLQARRAAAASRPILGFGLAYQAQTVSEALPVSQGPGVSLLLADTKLRYAAWITGAYRMPSDIETPALDIRMRSLAVRTGGGWGVRLGPPWFAMIGLAAGMDIVRVDSELRSGQEGRLSPSITSLSPTVGPVLALGVAMHQTLVVLQAGLDVDLARTRYLVHTDGASAYVLSPWALRPGLTLSMLATTDSARP
jgi:hypothetical protein